MLHILQIRADWIIYSFNADQLSMHSRSICLSSSILSNIYSTHFLMPLRSHSNRFREESLRDPNYTAALIDWLIAVYATTSCPTFFAASNFRGINDTFLLSFVLPGSVALSCSSLIYRPPTSDSATVHINKCYQSMRLALTWQSIVDGQLWSICL